jgi:hypothetical protein
VCVFLFFCVKCMNVSVSVCLPVLRASLSCPSSIRAPARALGVAHDLLISTVIHLIRVIRVIRVINAIHRSSPRFYSAITLIRAGSAGGGGAGEV